MLVRALVFLLLSAGACAASPRIEYTIPPATQFMDLSDNMWTVKDGVVYKNGVPDTASDKSVKLIRYYTGDILKIVPKDSPRFCNIVKLNTTEWPAGDAGWQQVSVPGIYRQCPQLKKHDGSE